MKVLILACLLVFLASCGHEAGKSLGDGYLHVDTDRHNTWVVRGSATIVATNVTQALAIGEFIVGLRVRSEKFVGVAETDVSDAYGYFVFDKATKSLNEGLSEVEIKQLFTTNGWDFSDLSRATL